MLTAPDDSPLQSPPPPPSKISLSLAAIVEVVVVRVWVAPVQPLGVVQRGRRRPLVNVWKRIERKACPGLSRRAIPMQWVDETRLHQHTYRRLKP
jgi:hypothetical protein